MFCPCKTSLTKPYTDSSETSLTSPFSNLVRLVSQNYFSGLVRLVSDTYFSMLARLVSETHSPILVRLVSQTHSLILARLVSETHSLVLARLVSGTCFCNYLHIMLCEWWASPMTLSLLHLSLSLFNIFICTPNKIFHQCSPYLNNSLMKFQPMFPFDCSRTQYPVQPRVCSCLIAIVSRVVI